MLVIIHRSVSSSKIHSSKDSTSKLTRPIKPQHPSLNAKTIHLNEKILKLQNRRLPLKNECILNPIFKDKL